MRARTFIPRSLFLAPVVLLLSLSLVISTGQHDRATAATTAVPAVVAGAAKSVPLRLITSASPVGLAINGVAIGAILYAERDTWWPVVKGLFNPAGGANAGGVAASFGITKVVGSSDVASGFALSGEALISNGVFSTASNFSFWARNRSCMKPDGSTYTAAPQMTIGSSAGPVGAGTHKMGFGFTPVKVCTVGDLLLGAEIGMSGGTTAHSATMYWQRPVADVDYVQTSVVRCKNLATGAMNTISVTTTGETEKMVVPSCEQRFPGSVPWDVNVKGGPAVGTQRDLFTATHNQTIWDTNEYGDCFSPTNGLICFVEIQIDGVPCLMGQGNCPNWKEMWKRHPDRVQCMFGSHVLPIADCDYLRYAYTKTKTVTQLDTNGQPELNPEVTTSPNPNPTPSPTPNPTPAPSPAPTAGPNPTAPPTVTVDDNPDSQGCYGEAWGWNPIDWVLVPVKCALKWAFVPSAGFYDTKINGLKTQFDSSTLGNYLTVVQGMVPAGASGCQGPEFRIGDTGSHYPMSACSGSPATLAASSRLILTIAISLGAGFACLRILGRSIGWDPAIGGERA